MMGILTSSQLDGFQEKHLLKMAEVKQTQSSVLTGIILQLNHTIWGKITLNLLKALLSSFLLLTGEMLLADEGTIMERVIN